MCTNHMALRLKNTCWDRYLLNYLRDFFCILDGELGGRCRLSFRRLSTLGRDMHVPVLDEPFLFATLPAISVSKTSLPSFKRERTGESQCINNLACIGCRGALVFVICQWELHNRILWVNHLRNLTRFT